MEPVNPITRISVVSENEEAVHEVGGDIVSLVDSLTEQGTAFIVHEEGGDGEILCTTVYPMPGNGRVIAIEIERG